MCAPSPIGEPRNSLVNLLKITTTIIISLLIITDVMLMQAKMVKDR